MLTAHSIMSSMLPQKRIQHDNETPSFNLDRVLRQFATQPELLELILSSKVEEDRRRAEEAKLKQKEIDYVIQQQKKTDRKETTYTAKRFSTRNDPPLASHPPTPSTPPYRSSPSIEWHPSSIILPPLTSPPKSAQPLFKHTTYKRLSECSSDDEKQDQQSMNHPQAPPSPPNESLPTTKRRRREMQAVTTIVETKEFPYNDDYLWRNNGNTTHKKSGNKSIYYKCANGPHGCPVNKTCTLRQDTGEYLIKYRGTHLPDCSTIKRINEV